jgi:uncharacterized protein (TIGR00297 family)
VLDQEQRMRWQSWLVLAAVVPWCAVAALRHATTVWNGATQTALGISLGLALLVFLARAATPLAALTGGVITAVLALAPLPASGLSSWYHSALPPLLALFLLTFSATRFGRAKKQRLGVAGLGAAAALGHPLPGTCYAVAVAAALAEATADTLASEFGEVLGGRPLMVTTRRRVPPGTNGAISVAGTLAGSGGAVLVVLVATLTLGFGVSDAVGAGLGAVGGLFVDSLLGSTAERRGWLNNDAVNFLSTFAAAVIAGLCFAVVHS